MGAKNIRTVSDLSEITSLEDEDLFEVSQNIGYEKFSSKKIKYENLKKIISDVANNTVQDEFKILPGTEISSVVDFATNTVSSSIDFGPAYINMKKAVILNETSENINSVQTRGQILEMMEDGSNYVAQDSKVNVYPGNDNGYTKNYEYMWSIDSGDYDSSNTIMEDGHSQRVIMNDTGYLTIYGWLASNANIQPQNAWVGLYAKIFCQDIDGNGSGERWVLLQVQPWILGENCQIMQYVGFNVPVKRGLELKIMTGFPVNGSTSGLQGYDHNLLLTDIGNTVNTFVGYIIKTSI